MKKFISAAVAALILLLSLCSCGENPNDMIKTSADMLCIVNNEKTFLGCSERFNSVAAPVCAIVQILETQNNEVIKKQDETDYFKNERYILTSFEPFEFNHFNLTSRFDGSLDESSAKSVFSTESEGMDILYKNKGEKYSLSFVSEELTKKCTAEYDKSNDSLFYSYTVETEGTETTEEFLEFTETEDGVYLIQTNKVRAYVIFDENNIVSSFACSELNAGDYSDEIGIYPKPKDINAENAESWVLGLDKSEYLSIHTYRDHILTHEDCSSGPWKKTEINALGYSTVFNM